MSVTAIMLTQQVERKHPHVNELRTNSRMFKYDKRISKKDLVKKEHTIKDVNLI